MPIRSLIPNLLSLSRILCVPVVFFCSPGWRLPFLLFVTLTDFLDGYLARKWNVTSAFGTLIDPLGDKGLALAYAYLFWSEGMLSVPQIMIFFSRDIALLVFTAYLIICGKRREWQIQSFWCGKAATTFQALIILYLCLGCPAPFFVYGLMLLLGVLSLPELLYTFQFKNRFLPSPKPAASVPENSPYIL